MEEHNHRLSSSFIYEPSTLEPEQISRTIQHTYQKPNKDSGAAERRPFSRFHAHCGRTITLSEANTVARRETGFAHAMCLSSRPLVSGEIFMLEIQEVENGWSGHLRLGLTRHDPDTGFDFPTYSMPDFVGLMGQAWVFAVTPTPNDHILQPPGGPNAPDNDVRRNRREYLRRAAIHNIPKAAFPRRRVTNSGRSGGRHGASTTSGEHPVRSTSEASVNRRTSEVGSRAGRGGRVGASTVLRLAVDSGRGDVGNSCMGCALCSVDASIDSLCTSCRELCLGSVASGFRATSVISGEADGALSESTGHREGDVVGIGRDTVERDRVKSERDGVATRRAQRDEPCKNESRGASRNEEGTVRSNEGRGHVETANEGRGHVETTNEGRGPVETTNEGRGPVETANGGRGHVEIADSILSAVRRAFNMNAPPRSRSSSSSSSPPIYSDTPAPVTAPSRSDGAVPNNRPYPLPTEVGSRIGITFLAVDDLADIYLVVNGELIGPCARSIPVIPNRPFFAVVDVYGMTKRVKVLQLYVAESLQSLCRDVIISTVPDWSDRQKLPLPRKLKSYLW